LYNLPQKLAAEFLGTFAIVFTAAGTLCAQQYLRDANQPGMGPLEYALAYGLITAAMMAALGHISGGHLNPAITVGLWVTRRIGTLNALFYCIAQTLGGVAAAYALIAVLPDTTWAASGLRLITPGIIADFSRWNAMVLECAVTGILVFVYFACAVGTPETFPPMAAFAVGSTLAVETLFAAPFTGAALNPARVLGPAFATRHWQSHGVYWVGPLFGGILAAVIYDNLFLRRRRDSL
jgi:MIP family channel proteins